MRALGLVKGDGRAGCRWTDGRAQESRVQLRQRKGHDGRIQAAGLERLGRRPGIVRFEHPEASRAQRVREPPPPLGVPLQNEKVERPAHPAQASPAAGAGPLSGGRGKAPAVTQPPPACLATLEPGTRIQDRLLVLEIERRALGTRDATVLTLGNAHGRLPSAPFWEETQHRVAGLARGDVVEVAGRVGAYRGRRQLAIESIRRLSGDLVDPRILLPALADVGPCWAALDRWRAALRPSSLARVVALFYDDPLFRRRCEQCPASPAGHHAVLGGLLRHTFEVASIGRAIAGIAGADGNLVLAGALLHDIGKLEAYAWTGPFELTRAGMLLGHVALGARMLDRRVRESTDTPCSPPELDLLLHLLLSHHGRLEFGAAVQPMTLEAEILHYADDASARSASMADAVRDAANFTGPARFSSRIWQLDRRRVYRGEGEFEDRAPPTRPAVPPAP
jgi:3'-5' exoribonuclease